MVRQVQDFLTLDHNEAGSITALVLRICTHLGRQGVVYDLRCKISNDLLSIGVYASPAFGRHTGIVVVNRGWRT
jgi:hypothetical protein